MIGLRLAFSITLLLGWLFNPVAVAAQQAAKVARIGWLGFERAGAAPRSEAFLQGLRDLGYVEGRNVVIEYRDAEGKPERLRQPHRYGRQASDQNHSHCLRCC